MDIEEPRANFVNRLHHIRSRAHSMAHINAAADAGIGPFERLENVQRRRPELILGAVVVDGDTDVVFLDELLQARQRLGGGIAGHDHADAGALAILKLGADVGVFIPGKVDGAGGVQMDASGGVIGQSCGFSLRIGGQVVLDVFYVEIADTKLLEEADHLRASELAKGVTGDAQPSRE